MHTTKYSYLFVEEVLFYGMDYVFFARFVISALFLTSAIAKVGSSSTFVQAVQQLSLGLFSPRFVQAIAWLLPPFEFLLSLALIIGPWPKAIALVTLGLLLLFTAPIAIHLIQGNRFPCNCFGHMSSDIGVGSLIRNIVLIIISLLLVIVSPWTVPVLGSLSMDAVNLSGPDTIALLTAGIGLYLFLVSLSKIDTLLLILKRDRPTRSKLGNI